MKKILSIFLILIISLLSFVSCFKYKYNAIILNEGFTFDKVWLENTAILSENKTFIIKNQITLNEIFSNFKDVNFEKEMVIVYCYTTIYMREQKLKKLSLKNNILYIEFDISQAKLGIGDCTAPQIRTCVIQLKKVTATEIKVIYKGQ